jgi:steroid delta-isomerase-like uncharacterized protein
MAKALTRESRASRVTFRRPGRGNSNKLQSQVQKEGVMTGADNLVIQQKFGSAVNTGELELLRDLIASDVVDHDPAPDQSPGPEGYIRMFAALRTSFPDLAVSVDQLVVDGDKIAIAYTLSGTHRGEFMDVAPTGRKIRARGVQIARFRDDKMVERWGSSDQLGILQQIGARATPTPPYSRPKTVD